MSSSISKDEKSGNISLSISATTGKKAKLASVSLSFGDNKYSPILSTLLWIYSQEKILPGFMNGNTFTYSAIAGHNSITFTCPDVKIFAIIQQIYLYLLKLKIPANIARTIVYEGDSKDAYYKRLQRIKVVIVGSCKSTCAKIASNDKKYDAFKKNLSELYNKYKDSSSFDANQNKSAQINNITLNITKPSDSNDLLPLYLAIILGDVPCTIKFSGSNSIVIKFINPCDNCVFVHKTCACLDQFTVFESQHTGDTANAVFCRCATICVIYFKLYEINISYFFRNRFKNWAKHTTRTAPSCPKINQCYAITNHF